MLVTSLACKVVTKSWGPGIFPGYYKSEPSYFHGKQKEIEPKVLPSYPIPLLQIPYIQELEMLMTT